jgi:hypothetical protein
MSCAGHVDYAERELKCIQDFGEENRVGEPTCKTKAYRLGDNIKMYFRDGGWGH